MPAVQSALAVRFQAVPALAGTQELVRGNVFETVHLPGRPVNLDALRAVRFAQPEMHEIKGKRRPFQSGAIASSSA